MCKTMTDLCIQSARVQHFSAFIIIAFVVVTLIKATTRQLKPLEEKLKEQKNELEKACREKETYVDGRRIEMSSLRNKKDNIVSSNKEVDR